MAKLQHIFIAPKQDEAMQALSAVEALADCGLRGDRYCDARIRKNPGYQLTLIESEQIAAFTAATDLPLAPHEPRRNLVTSGVRLNDLLGRRFLVGEVELEGIELCEPCAVFGRRTHMQVVRFFVHKGGLRARIVRGGTVHVGDRIAAQ